MHYTIQANTKIKLAVGQHFYWKDFKNTYIIFGLNAIRVSF